MYGTTPRTTKREPVVVLQPLWPRYLFLDVEGRDPDFPGVMAVRGVCDVVRGADRQPLPLPDSAGVALRAIYGGLRNERDTSRLSAFFQGRVGDRFNFRLDSPFSGFVGTIVSLTRLDEAEEIQAWIDAFGRRTPVTLKFGDVGSVISPADEGVLAAA
jgi:transcription antitermination factor NusG